MTRFLRLMLIVLALCTLGARELPRPCLGDGLGNACASDRCTCTALCSCRATCSMAAADDTPACHMHAGAAPEAPTHFTLPDSPPPMLLAGAQPLMVTAGYRAHGAFVPRCPPPFSLSPPEPPPRRRDSLV